MNTEVLRYINISLEIWGGLSSLVVLLCTLLAPHAKDRVHVSFSRIMLCNIALLFCDALAWGAKGRPGPAIRVVLLGANFCVFIFTFLLLGFFADYLDSYIRDHGVAIDRVRARISWGICALGMALVVLSQFNHIFYLVDENNVYQRQSLFWISQALGIAGMAVNAQTIWRYRRSFTPQEKVAFFSYISFSVAAMVAQLFMYGIAFLHLATTLSILVIYMLLQVEQSRRFRQTERMLHHTQVAIMLSQIQPHFLYNALTAITRLCDADAQRAKSALQDFSVYLRINLDSLSCRAPVSFEQELRHVQIYLDLEKMRFDDELSICYQIGPTRFMLPVLTLQPLVENAVRHGLSNRPGGGTVTLITREGPDVYLVQVKDDGVGYDPDAPLSPRRSHVGIANVRSRLAAQLGGSLDIASAPGQGTVATIAVPKAAGGTGGAQG